MQRTEAVTTGSPAQPQHRRRVLLRLAGELGTKSTRTRRRFLAILLANTRRALREAGVPARVEHGWSRIWVDTPDPARARRALSSVFGVQAAVEVLEVPFQDLDGLVGALVPLYRERVRGRTFGVQARRLGAASVSPHDLAVALGSALLGDSAGVDLDHPEVAVPVLVGDGFAYARGAETEGPAGLPLGSGGRALALLSGGFDSPVAAWHVMRRGVELDLLHFDLGGCGEVDAALLVARELMRRWAPGTRVTVHIVDLAPLVEVLRARCPGKLRQVLLKRAMYRAAGQLARELQVEAIVTGEAIAQVSTQTLRSLAVCEAAAGLPVLRPLVGMDKTDIIARAGAIGTRESSERVQELCSIADGKVVTWPVPGSVEAAEAEMGGTGDGDWTAARLAGRRTLDLRSWEPPAKLPTETPHGDVELAAIPEGALVVDVREPYEGPPVGDVQLPYSGALERLDLLDSDHAYVLVCPAGQRSRRLAGELRQRGITAWSLRGGLKRLPADYRAGAG
jgi:thiamine biosynthesis protein ThiI